MAAGISLRTVERAELGQSEPRPVVVAAMAGALGVEVESLTMPRDKGAAA
jgi:transcriptional regulator with XRE-family HTH domain